MATALDSDRAIENEGKDQFGFVGMAKRLAPSIIEASKGDGMVIGLEGRWGSGKTSLLNFLRTELVAAEGEGISSTRRGYCFSLAGSAEGLMCGLRSHRALIGEHV